MVLKEMLTGVGLILIIVFGISNFNTDLAFKTGNSNMINMSGYDYNTYNDLFNNDKATIDNKQEISTNTLGEIVFAGGYNVLRNIITGQWLVYIVNLVSTSLGFSPVSNIVINIIGSIIVGAILLTVIGAFIGREL